MIFQDIGLTIDSLFTSEPITPAEDNDKTRIIIGCSVAAGILFLLALTILVTKLCR